MNNWYAAERFSAEHRAALLDEVARDRRVRAAQRDTVPGPVGTRPTKAGTWGLAIVRALRLRPAG